MAIVKKKNPIKTVFFSVICFLLIFGLTVEFSFAGSKRSEWDNNVYSNWQGDVYSSRIKQLKKTYEIEGKILQEGLPDLLIEQVEVSDSNVTAGEKVTFTVIIHNFGGTPASNIKVNFLSGDGVSFGEGYQFQKAMSSDYSLIEERTIPLLNPDSSCKTNFSWKVTGSEGMHDLKVVIDPDNTITEAYKDNNEGGTYFYIDTETPKPYAIYGYVSDYSGKNGIAGAKVQIKNLRTGETIDEIVTDKKGRYIENLLNFKKGYRNDDNIEIKAGYSDAIGNYEKIQNVIKTVADRNSDDDAGVRKDIILQADNIYNPLPQSGSYEDTITNLSDQYSLFLDNKLGFHIREGWNKITPNFLSRSAYSIIECTNGNIDYVVSCNPKNGKYITFVRDFSDEENDFPVTAGQACYLHTGKTSAQISRNGWTVTYTTHQTFGLKIYSVRCNNKFILKEGDVPGLTFDGPHGYHLYSKYLRSGYPNVYYGSSYFWIHSYYDVPIPSAGETATIEVQYRFYNNSNGPHFWPVIYFSGPYSASWEFHQRLDFDINTSDDDCYSYYRNGQEYYPPYEKSINTDTVDVFPSGPCVYRYGRFYDERVNLNVCFQYSGYKSETTNYIVRYAYPAGYGHPFNHLNLEPIQGYNNVVWTVWSSLYNYSSNSTSSLYFIKGEECSIPSYTPSYWNDGDHGSSIQRNNNCYNYSNNRRTDTFAQPGKAVGQQYTAYTCTDISNAAIADGLEPISSSATCPDNMVKVALAVYPDSDYHWYRQDSDGMWSHKIGTNEATNLDDSYMTITNPETANMVLYTDFCGYFCTCSDEEEGYGHANIE